MSTLSRNFPTTMFLTMRNVVGSHLREARHRAGRRLTQEELAARLQSQGIDIDRTAISKIETGKRPVMDFEIVAICQTLNIKIATLFGEE